MSSDYVNYQQIMYAVKFKFKKDTWLFLYSKFSPRWLLLISLDYSKIKIAKP